MTFIVCALWNEDKRGICTEEWWYYVDFNDAKHSYELFNNNPDIQACSLSLVYEGEGFEPVAPKEILDEIIKVKSVTDKLNGY